MNVNLKIKCWLEEKAMKNHSSIPGYQDMLNFGLIEALLGRRSRRFFMGAEILDGVFAYKSKHDPIHLNDLEKTLIITACGSNTGWHNMIYRASIYAPHLANYAGAAGGRTFPSSAGFETSMTFFTDEEGVYMLDARDTRAFADRNDEGTFEFEAILQKVKDRIVKLQNSRLKVPSETPYTEAHNTWVFNHPGSFLVIPVGDLSGHVLLGLCYMLQNGLVLTDDINDRSIPGIEKFNHIVDITNTWPLSFVEQTALSEISVELGTSCYAGALMLQAMGLGGWMFDGVDFLSILGASGDPAVPGLGFRYDFDKRWNYNNPTGLNNIMEGYCPPHHTDMRAAVEALCERKFGPGGPFHAETPGPWKDSAKVRSAAQVHNQEFRDCITLQAQYVYDTFGKFPGTVPSMFCNIYLQAQHIDLDFYDKFYKPGAYLKTHANHMQGWHHD